MAQLSFSLNISRCTGCMACVVACMDQNDLPDNLPGFRYAARVETGSYPSAAISFSSISCFNCRNAPCITVCPAGAIKRRTHDGIVQADHDLCIGCRACLAACPFGAPVFSDGKKMSKCNSCLERVDHNLEPACVRICPTRALAFGPADDLPAENSEQDSKNSQETQILQIP